LGGDAIAQNARAPFVALGPAARPFRFSGSVSERIDARACLAAAMVYEAGDDAIGQLAVGQVILNRVRHPAFPASVCGVVTQGSERATGCQFTFTCDGSLTRDIALPVRARALAHADLMLDGMVFAGVGLATHYHTTEPATGEDRPRRNPSVFPLAGFLGIFTRIRRRSTRE
jgi:spore germination cell wall hydrolase CwlJ-like protein